MERMPPANNDSSAERLAQASGSGAVAALKQGDEADALPLDVLSDVLRSVRLTGAMYFLVEASTPWMSWAPAASDFAPVVLPQAQHLVSYHVVTRGACWAGLRGKPPQRLEAGDVLVVPHGDPYFLATPPDAPPEYDDAEAMAFFRDMVAGKLPSVVEAGHGGPGRTDFICGFLGCDRRPFNPLLAALPEVVFLRAAATPDDRLRHLVAFALGELRQRSAGSQEMLLRLSELMFVETVRRYLSSLPEAHTGWLAGLRDPLVASALARLHREPARAWTLDALAAEAGASRSVLAERFAHHIGQPPMHYLTAWRMQLATRLLAAPGARVKRVAEAVGYESEAAFSRAFKKRVGVAPMRWRESGAEGFKPS